MTPRIFAALGGVAALSLVAAGAIYNISSRWQPSELDRSLLFPGLFEQVNDIATITVSSAGHEMSIARVGEKWLIQSLGGYPADVTKVRSNIVGVAELHRIEPKTANPELYPRISVEDPDLEDATSYRFALLNVDGDPLAALIVGKRKPGIEGPGRNGAYVRIEGEDQAWLAGGDIKVSLDLVDWLDTMLLDLEVPDVARMSVTRGSAYPIELTRSAGESGGYQIGELPEGLEPATNYALQSIVRRAVQVRFDDVRAAGDAIGEETVTAFETTGGATISIAIGEPMDDGARWLRLSAAGEGDGTAALNERYAGFEFRVPPRDAETLVVKLADVISAEGS